MKETLLPVFKEILDGNAVSYEIDPDKKQEGDDLAKNTENLKDLADMFLIAIIKSAASLPLYVTITNYLLVLTSIQAIP